MTANLIGYENMLQNNFNAVSPKSNWRCFSKSCCYFRLEKVCSLKIAEL